MNQKSHFSLALSIPLLNPSSPLLTTFSCRWRAPAPPPPTSPSSSILMPPIPSPGLVIPLPFPFSLSPRWSRAPTPAPAPSTPRVMKLPKQLPPQLPPNHLNVHKIAIATSITALLLELPARRLTKISHRRKISDNRPAGVKPPLQSSQCCCSLIFLAKLNIDIPNHVISEIIADI